jgi:desulfoferrodoxin (superoxide reductase-like protein)
MKQAFFAVMAIIPVFYFSEVYGHPPTDIKVSYDPATMTVNAVITHPVADPATHFIKKVDVSLNGKEVISQEIGRQDDSETQTVIYRLPDVKEGDAIEVEAYCNIAGVLKTEIKVAK